MTEDAGCPVINRRSNFIVVLRLCTCNGIMGGNDVENCDPPVPTHDLLFLFDASLYINVNLMM